MKSTICLLTMLLFTNLVHGQQLWSVAGNSGSGGGISLDWTIGETLSETLHGSTVHLTQGFHQGRLIVTSIAEKLGHSSNIKVFPNPVSFSLHIGFGSNDFPNAQLLLFDAAGNRIFYKVASGQQLETIDMEVFPPGAYLLQILSIDQKTVKTAKVLKK